LSNDLLAAGVISWLIAAGLALTGRATFFSRFILGIGEGGSEDQMNAKLVKLLLPCAAIGTGCPLP
jgi:hypothetical protein